MVTSFVTPNRRFSTGLEFLDRRLDGGIPVGKLLTITAPAGSQSELFLYHFATSQPLRYISTTNPIEDELKQAFESSGITGTIDIEFEYVPPQDLLTDPDQYLTDILPESFVAIDPVDALEQADNDDYLSLVTTLKQRLRKTDSVGIFHALDTDPIPDNRRLTLKRSDYVWQLEQQFNSREINSRLLLTKARGGRAQSEPVPIVLSNSVHVDTSRNIA